MHKRGTSAALRERLRKGARGAIVPADVPLDVRAAKGRASALIERAHVEGSLARAVAFAQIPLFREALEAVEAMHESLRLALHAFIRGGKLDPAPGNLDHRGAPCHTELEPLAIGRRISKILEKHVKRVAAESSRVESFDDLPRKVLVAHALRAHVVWRRRRDSRRAVESDELVEDGDAARICGAVRGAC